MQEGVSHLHPTHSHGLQHRGLLPIIFDINSALQDGLVGLSLLDVDSQVDDEAEDLLADLTEHSVKLEFVYRHEWRPHDLVFWDNRCCMHIAEPPPKGSRRHMHQTTVMGDRPY